MFAPTSTISVTGWMLQSVDKQKQKQRAQALDANGNEHAFAYWGEQTTETAEFTLGGTYANGSTITVPSLGSGIIEYTLTYSETEFPKLSVQKNSAAGGTAFSLPSTGDDAISLPARALGVPASITGIYQGLTKAKTVQIHVACQHVEETDGTGTYGTLHGMRDATVTVTITGTDGKPAFGTATGDGMADGWTSPSDQEGDSNTAIPTGSVVYEKHFPIVAAS